MPKLLADGDSTETGMFLTIFCSHSGIAPVAVLLIGLTSAYLILLFATLPALRCDNLCMSNMSYAAST